MPNYRNVNDTVIQSFELANLILAAYWFIMTLWSTIGMCGTNA